MKYENFTMSKDGFAGHLAEPDKLSDTAVIVIMGGEKSILPGIKIAERFADYGLIGLSVSLFGTEGLPEGPDRIPADMFINAVRYLREVRKVRSLSIYGVSMGTLFAVLAAKYSGEADNVILVSPSHVMFEGTKDKKNMTGHSAATWRGKEISYVTPDFSVKKASRYYYDKRAGRKVMGMWCAYKDAYEDKQKEKDAYVGLEELDARILMIAGTGDEAWPSDYSVKYFEDKLKKSCYKKEYKTIIYPGASHLLGMMPAKQQNKMLYRLMPVIGLMYASIRKNKEKCLSALENSEREIIAFIRNSCTEDKM